MPQAFVMMYSVIDKSSFQRAEELLSRLHEQDLRGRPVILVGNKIDLVRSRVVSSQGMVTTRCMYISTIDFIYITVDRVETLRDRIFYFFKFEAVLLKISLKYQVLQIFNADFEFYVIYGKMHRGAIFTPRLNIFGSIFTLGLRAPPVPINMVPC